MKMEWLLTVSSVQIAWTWVPNMMAVKRTKSMDSTVRANIKITVAGGEKKLHSPENSRHRKMREITQ